MRLQNYILPIAAIILIAGYNGFAYWPTTVEENLPVAVQPDTNEVWCSALPYPDGATLVILDKGWIGNCYQIIDRYGQLKYPLPQPLTPGYISGYMWEPHVIADGSGGAFIAWLSWGPNPVQGIIAQRLDSLGNIMWGDSGIVISPFTETDFDISVDGQGGMFLGINPDGPPLRAQRIDGEGNLLWGPEGIEVSPNPYGQRYVKITHGAQGDVYIIWEDHRPPYTTWGALYATRIGPDGSRLWADDLYLASPIFDSIWNAKLIPDGQGGIIVQCQIGSAGPNTHWRVGSSGNIIWTRNDLSWYYGPGALVEGEPGYFYLGFIYNPSIRGQRARISDGNPMWAPAPIGAVFGSLPAGWMGSVGGIDFRYKYPFFYSAFGFARDEQHFFYYGQALDSLGRPIMGSNGTLMCNGFGEVLFNYVNAVPSGDDGLILVYEDELDYDYDIWAKRTYLDGTLGGPNAPIEEVNIIIDDSSAVLTWLMMADSAQYHIYRSAEPYSFSALPDTTVIDTFFFDPDALNQNSLFYRVTWEL